MPVSVTYKADILAKLGAACDLQFKHMFGGLGLYAGGVMFGLVDDDRTYFKVDEATSPQFDAIGAIPWTFTGGPTNMKYRSLPDSIRDDQEKLAAWIEQAVAVAVRTAGKKKK